MYKMGRRGFSALPLALFLVLGVSILGFVNVMPSNVSGFRDILAVVFVGLCAVFVVLGLKTSGGL